MKAFCWTFCGCCGDEEEDAKQNLLLIPSWEGNDDYAAEARKHRENSLKIRQMESFIEEAVRQRQLKQEERRHRLTVFATQVVATECPQSYPKSKEELQFLDKVLVEDRNFIFCDMEEKERRFIVDVLAKDKTIQKGDVLFAMGDVGEYFYIIDQGQVDILDGHSTGKIRTRTLGRGDSFGEQALLFDVPRMTSARARTDCVLWKMHQQSFRAKLAHHAMTQEEEMMGLLKKITLFEGMEDAELRKFANAMERVHFQPEERIVNKGDIGTIFYIIEQGTVRIHGIGLGDSQSADLELTAGDFFGERSFLTGEPRYAHTTALSAVTAWAVDRETFETTFGSLQHVIEHNTKKRLLKVIPIFADSEDITETELDQLAERMQTYCHKEGHRIDELGKPYSQELIMIQKGRIAVYDGKGDKDKVVFTLKTGGYYGDKHIRDDPVKLSCFNVICEENATVYALTKKDLLEVVGDLTRLGEPIDFSLSRRVSNYSSHRILSKDLEKLRVLGHGGFGKVWLVKHLQTGEHYALKELNKRRILDRQQTKNVLREKDILSTLRHPFILGQVSSFQDESNLYILTNLVQGGELYTIIVNTKGKGLPLNDAVFYGSCIHSALSHFHARNIVYRDLKP